MARAPKTSINTAGQAKEGAYLATSTEARRRKLLLDILDSDEATHAEKLSAIRELRAMEDGQSLATDGFSTWPRERIVAELDRLSAQVKA